MPLPNKTKLNLILDILLDFFLECYILILWNKKKLIMFKLCLTLKKIFYALDVNLLDYLCNKKALLIDYLETKLFVLVKDNEMMKQYLDNKDHLKSLRPNLIFGFSHEFVKRNECEGEIKKIGGNPKNQSELANGKNNDGSEGLKI